MEVERMNKTEIIKIFSIFNVAYSKFIIPGKEEMMLEVWHEMLQEYPYNQVAEASKNHIRSSKFPPTIHDIIDRIQEMEDIGKDDGLTAWARVTKAIRYYGYYREPEAMESLPEDIRSVVQAMGYQTLCQSENEVADRAHFCKAYETQQKRNATMRRIGELMPEKQQERLRS